MERGGEKVKYGEDEEMEGRIENDRRVAESGVQGSKVWRNRVRSRLRLCLYGTRLKLI